MKRRSARSTKRHDGRAREGSTQPRGHSGSGFDGDRLRRWRIGFRQSGDGDLDGSTDAHDRCVAARADSAAHRNEHPHARATSGNSFYGYDRARGSDSDCNPGADRHAISDAYAATSDTHAGARSDCDANPGAHQHSHSLAYPDTRSSVTHTGSEYHARTGTRGYGHTNSPDQSKTDKPWRGRVADVCPRQGRNRRPR